MVERSLGGIGCGAAAVAPGLRTSFDTAGAGAAASAPGRGVNATGPVRTTCAGGNVTAALPATNAGIGFAEIGVGAATRTTAGRAAAR